MKALNACLTCDLSCSPWMETLREWLSTKVTRHLWLRCGCIANGPHVSEGTWPSKQLVHVTSTLQIPWWGCLPLRGGVVEPAPMQVCWVLIVHGRHCIKDRSVLRAKLVGVSSFACWNSSLVGADNAALAACGVNPNSNNVLHWPV